MGTDVIDFHTLEQVAVCNRVAAHGELDVDHLTQPVVPGTKPHARAPLVVGSTRSSKSVRQRVNDSIENSQRASW